MTRTGGQTVRRAPSVRDIIGPRHGARWRSPGPPCSVPGTGPAVGHRHARPADTVLAGLPAPSVSAAAPRRHGPHQRRPAGPTSTTARAGSSSSTASTPSTSRALRAVRRPGQAVELLGGRRLAHGAVGLQRGPPGHDLERPGAGDGPGQRPGHLRPRASPTNPHQFNQAVLDRYVAHLKQTVDLLGRFHIFTILDMHQDVYNEMFEGEGAPTWAVCTDGVREHRPAGPVVVGVRDDGGRHRVRPLLGNNVARRPAGPVRPGLGRRGARVPRATAGSSASTPSTSRSRPSLVHFRGEHFDAQLECFYTGPVHGHAAHTALRRCAARRNDPASGVVPTILANDPGAWSSTSRTTSPPGGFPTYLGPMGLRNLVYNVHLYCGARSPVTGNPTNLAAVRRAGRALARRARSGPAGDGLAAAAGRTGLAGHRVRCDERARRSWRASRRRSTPRRSDGSTGRGSTTATHRERRPSRW